MQTVVGTWKFAQHLPKALFQGWSTHAVEWMVPTQSMSQGCPFSMVSLMAIFRQVKKQNKL